MALAWGPLIYSAFGILDWIIYPELLSIFWLMRAAFVGLNVSLWLWVRRAKSYREVMAISVTEVFAGCVGIVLMCHFTEGISSPYYPGLMLCFLFAAATFTWPVKVAVVVFSSALLLYFAPPLFLGGAPLDLQAFSLSAFFLFGTMSISLLGMNVRNRLAYQAYLGEQELARRNAELAELQALKDRMFQNVSHELRTPLTLLLTPLESRLQGPESLPEAERRWTESLYRNGMRLMKLVNDLLDLARLDAARLSVDREPVEVASLVRGLVADVRSAAESAGVEVSSEVGDSPTVYRLDAEHVERVLLNLLANALKFTPPGGRVIAGMEEDGEGLRLWVEDTGVGIGEEDRERIFERFHQLDDSETRQHGGSGIGLSLVSELAHLLGGWVEVESVAGEGSRFTVHFPVELKSDDEAAAVEGGSLQRRAELEALRGETSRVGRLSAGRHGPRVLVAEDDGELRKHLAEMLGRRHRVVAVEDGERALEEALLLRPDVVVSDVMMPGMDGVTLSRRLRERAELRETALVLLTAKGTVEDRIAGRRAGADSYLTKPFEMAELEATIEGLLRSRMRLVGSFLLRERLGSGGQGEVWLSEHRETGSPVALKLFRSPAVEDADVRSRLHREHEVLAGLSHPNIVRIVERGEQEAGLYLAMEYLEGVTVEELLRRQGRLAPGAVAMIGTRLCAALGAVHGEGLVHRDVKCSNVMVLRGGDRLGARVRLIDFGAVERVVPEGPGGPQLGTRAYLAPELASGSSMPSSWTDQYALGVSLYRMLTYRYPDRERVVGEEPAAGVPAGLWSIVLRAMAYDTAERWPNLQALGNELQHHADQKAQLRVRSWAPTHTATLSAGETTPVGK